MPHPYVLGWGLPVRTAWKRPRSLHTLASAMAFCAKGSIANKNKNFGEDCAIIKTWITPGPNQGASLIGVADGVGGWRRHGVDPSHLSSGILKSVGTLFDEAEGVGNGIGPTSQQLLTQAFSSLLIQREKCAGGTTVCIGQFNPVTAWLDLLNLGDSGALLIRDGKVVEHTVPDVEGMTPRQLTVLPSWMIKFRDVLEDDPEKQTKGTPLKWQLRKGDILVMATDGFYDNVSLDDTKKHIDKSIASSGLDNPKTPQNIADDLLVTAYYNSLDPDYASPFALRCSQDPDGFDYWGGKPDDISVVVSVVRELDAELKSHL